MRSHEVRQLVEVLGQQEHGRALRGRLPDPVVDELGRGDVEATGRVVQDEESRAGGRTPAPG